VLPWSVLPSSALPWSALPEERLGSLLPSWAPLSATAMVLPLPRVLPFRT
jgi:hypothetical protein